jgi:hypothetical protein
LGASVRRISILSVALGAGLAAAMLARAQDDTPLKFSCIVRDAQILPDRTHVRCANKGLNGLSEFAAETNQPYANRVAAAIVQSLRSGTTLVLTYAPSSELNPEGCLARNCRKIIDVGGVARLPAPPPRPAPIPISGPQPQIDPEDFDPVDATVEEPSATVPPPPPPAPPTRPMDPIPN